MVSSINWVEIEFMWSEVVKTLILFIDKAVPIHSTASTMYAQKCLKSSSVVSDGRGGGGSVTHTSKSNNSNRTKIPSNYRFYSKMLSETPIFYLTSTLAPFQVTLKTIENHPDHFLANLVQVSELSWRLNDHQDVESVKSLSLLDPERLRVLNECFDSAIESFNEYHVALASIKVARLRRCGNNLIERVHSQYSNHFGPWARPFTRSTANSATDITKWKSIGDIQRARMFNYFESETWSYSQRQRIVRLQCLSSTWFYRLDCVIAR